MKANASNAVPASANAPAARSLCNFYKESVKTLPEGGVFAFKEIFQAKYGFFLLLKLFFIKSELY